MTKKSLPLEQGKYYHIYNRACGFEKLFIDQYNYDFFLSLFNEYLKDIVDIYSYCLVPNHFHFLVKMKKLQGFKELGAFYSKKFSNLFNSYARSFNKFYNRRGNLFTQNFKRKEIDDLDYLRTVVIYIHRNPVKHGLVKDLSDWEFSSYHEIINLEPEVCRCKEVLKWFGNVETLKFCHSLETRIDLE